MIADNSTAGAFPDPTTAQPTFTAFADLRLVASGPREDVLRATKKHLEKDGRAGVLIFEDASGRQVDFDFRGSVEDVLERVRENVQSPVLDGRGLA